MAKKKQREKGYAECILPPCNASARRRGLCHVHLQAAEELVRDGILTWDQMEKAGTALPEQRRRACNYRWKNEILEAMGLELI